MVTEQDVIDNAALFAAIINGTVSDVTIGDLDPTTTMADSDPLHIQKGGVDKLILKSSFEALLIEEMATGYKNLVVDGDFNHNQGGVTSQSQADGDNYKTFDMWLPAWSGATGTFTVEAHTSTVSKLNYARMNITGADDFVRIETRLKGNIYSGKKMSTFIRCKYQTAAPTSLKAYYLDSAGSTKGVSDPLTGITGSWQWLRFDDVDVDSYASGGSRFHIKNTANETWDLDIDKIRVIETPENLLDGAIPEWITKDEDPLKTLPLIYNYYWLYKGGSLTTMDFMSYGRGADFVDVSVIRDMVQTPTVSTTANKLVDVSTAAEVTLSGGFSISDISKSNNHIMFRLNDTGKFTNLKTYCLRFFGTQNLILDARY